MLLPITWFTTPIDDLPRQAERLTERLEGQTYFNFHIDAGIEQGNGVITISRTSACSPADDWSADQKRIEALEMVVSVLSESL